MDLQLNGKRALVTGSSSGIGEGIAKALACEGATVIVHGRREAEANRIAEEIRSAGGKAVVALGDLTDNEAAQAVVDTAVSLLGGVDILVNNAGMFLGHSWEEATPQEWLQVYNANVVSMVRLIRLLIPQMKERGWGRFIQIASANSSNPGTFMPDYSATKSANVNMSVSLSRELSGTGITVNAVSPGPIVTEGWTELILKIAYANGWDTSNMDEVKERLLKMWNLSTGRLGTPEDVGNLVAFVASPLADYINGANLRVDGGFVPTTN